MIFVRGDEAKMELEDVSDRNVVVLVCGSLIALTTVLLIGCVLVQKALTLQYPWVRPRPGGMI